MNSWGNKAAFVKVGPTIWTQDSMGHQQLVSSMNLTFSPEWLGPEHPNVAASYNNLAELWTNKGEYDKALALLEKCLAIKLKTLGAKHQSVAISYVNMGIAWESKGEYAKALECYEKCLTIRMKTLGAEHPDVAKLAKNVNRIAKENGLTALVPDWIRSLDS